LEDNVEAWQIYQLACIGAMGITVEAIKKICDCFGVHDPAEILMKVKAIIEGIQSKEPE
jgi:hypothetical protein